MGIWGEIKKLAKPYDDEEDFDDFQPKMMNDELPLPPKTPAQARSSYGGFEEQNTNNKIVNHHATVKLKVALFNPERYDVHIVDEIAKSLLNKHTVVLNLEKTNKDDTRRILDFIGGVSYAQDGKAKQVALRTYLFTPYNVDLLGDLIDELEHDGLYF